MADRTNSHDDGVGGELRPVETDPSGTYSRVRSLHVLSIMMLHASSCNQAAGVSGMGCYTVGLPV